MIAGDPALERSDQVTKRKSKSRLSNALGKLGHVVSTTCFHRAYGQ